MEQHEPRFVGTLNEVDGRIEGLQFLSPTEIELTLYLNQMGVFNLVDDGTLPGCAALKLRTVSNNTQKWGASTRDNDHREDASSLLKTPYKHAENCEK